MSLPIADLPLFAGGTAALLWWSRKPLARPGSHGFYRFFAWEAILGLCVLNRNSAGDQLVSVILLQASLLPLALGFFALHRHGRSAASRGDGSDGSDGAMYDWERTTTLVTGGIYGVIRHPMYVSLFGLAWGMCFRALGGLPLALASMASYFLLRTALADERECLAYFGEPYRQYMRRTRRFIPWLF